MYTPSRNAVPWQIPLPDLWALINAPLDADDIALVAGASWYSNKNSVQLAKAWRNACTTTSQWSWKETLEKRARQITAFRSLGKILDTTGPGDLPCGITAETMQQEEQTISNQLTDVFAEELKNATGKRGKTKKK